MEIRRSFASDNNAGIHPEVLKAIAASNLGHVTAYGADPYTERAIEVFKKHWGPDIAVFFVFNGTGANVLCLDSMLKPFEAVICAASAHIQVDECGAPERWTGCKLLPVPTPDGKLTVDLMKPYCAGRGDQHHVQPRVVSLTQSTEMGTVYTSEEIKRLADFAHNEGMLVHMDGARLANAAAHLGLGLRQFTSDCGVDALSFGGTKNGLMGGEAVVLFRKENFGDFKFRRKQAMQLASKMRFLAVQFEALLTNDLWLKNAGHANAMARLLARELEPFKEIRLTQKVEANGVFAHLPRRLISALQKHYFFYVWDESRDEVRWMTAFDTTEDDVRGFVGQIKSLLHGT